MSYCPKCKSLLYPIDIEYIENAGVCSYCVTWDNTPDKRFKKAYIENMASKSCGEKTTKKSHVREKAKRKG